MIRKILLVFNIITFLVTIPFPQSNLVKDRLFFSVKGQNGPYIFTTTQKIIRLPMSDAFQTETQCYQLKYIL